MSDEWFWFIHRPVFEGVTTLTEIDEKLSLCDLVDLHEGLDVKEEIEIYYQRKNRK